MYMLSKTVILFIIWNLQKIPFYFIQLYREFTICHVGLNVEIKNVLYICVNFRDILALRIRIRRYGDEE